MKKQLLALAALAAVSGVAAAQSVTVYGIVDTGFYSTNASGSGNNSQLQAVSGTWLPSLWGITASEDIGGGLKAKVNLQSNLTSTTGGTSGFDRIANVEVAGGFGSLSLGRDIDIIFLQSFLNGVIPTHTNSLALNGTLWTNTGNTNATGSLSVFNSNAAKWTSPTVNGLTGTIQYAMGGVAGQTSANNIAAGLVTYNGGALSASLGYEQQNDASGNAGLKKTLAGAKYTINGIDLAAQYNGWKNGATLNTDGYEFGVAFHPSAATTVGVNYESLNDRVGTTNNKPQIVSLKAKYDFSKRTAVWGFVSNFNTDAANKIEQGYNLTTINATKSATGIGAGLTHQF